jgi:putative acetyltransferase
VIELRRAEPADVEFLVELANHPEVEPFLGPGRARSAEAIGEQVVRSAREPGRFGRIVIWVEDQRAGVMGYEELSERNRIARLEALAVHPEFRGRHIADEAARRLQRLLLLELGFHRLQLECFAFNGRAIAHAERSGFTREGVKRRAYLRDGEWVDSVMFALLREDLERPGLDGTWALDRTGGLLPPLGGVRKQIEGGRGWTIVGGRRLAFDVVGLELRYRAPLRGLVDELTPDGSGFSGTAMLFGRELGTFRMTRAS